MTETETETSGEDDPYLIQIVGIGSSGRKFAHSGKFLSFYDFTQNEKGIVDATDDPFRALEFKTGGQAIDCYRQVSPFKPTRADGKPNRPLTSVSIRVARRSKFLKELGVAENKGS